MNFFLLPYDINYELTKNSHPTKLILTIFGKSYLFNFSNGKETGINRDLLIEYSKVRVQPSSFQIIDTSQNNNIILKTPASDRFSYDELQSLYSQNNPCYCRVTKNHDTLICYL